MLKKVLCIGCSLTYGDELVNPSISSWPSLLGQLNNWKIHNIGKNRSSNDRIIRVAFEELHKQYDLVIIAWTQISRFEIFECNKNAYRDVSVLCPTIRNFKWAEDYYKHYSSENSNYRKWLQQVILLQSYLEKINQPYIFCNAFQDMSNLPEDSAIDRLKNQVDSRYYLGWMTDSILDWTSTAPKGLGHHPLEEGHIIIANKINSFIHNVYPSF